MFGLYLKKGKKMIQFLKKMSIKYFNITLFDELLKQGCISQK